MILKNQEIICFIFEILVTQAYPCLPPVDPGLKTTEYLLPFQCYFYYFFFPTSLFLFIVSKCLSHLASNVLKVSVTHLPIIFWGFDEGIWQIQCTFLMQFKWPISNHCCNGSRKLYFQGKKPKPNNKFPVPILYCKYVYHIGGTIPSACLGQWFAEGHRKNLPTNWKNSQTNFAGNLQGLILRIWITKHMPKFCEQPDLAGILKCKYSRHQTAHKVVLQKTSLRCTVGFLSGNGSQTEHHWYYHCFI